MTEEPVQIKQVLRIGITDEKVVIDGQLGNTALCLKCLAAAIQLVLDYEPPRIIKPGIGNRIKGAFGGNGGRKHV